MREGKCARTEGSAIAEVDEGKSRLGAFEDLYKVRQDGDC